MCLAAIYWARISEIAFAAGKEDAAAIGFDDAKIYHELCLPAEQRAINVKRIECTAAEQMMQKWPSLNRKY
jgi:tRNA(Arg) A34 adenosine deaminase TadA